MNAAVMAAALTLLGMEGGIEGERRQNTRLPQRGTRKRPKRHLTLA